MVSMEAGENPVAARTRQPVNIVELDHAVAVRTGPPAAARGLSRVNAPGVDPGEATSPRFSVTQGEEWTAKLVEGRKLEGMMSKPPNILVHEAQC